MWRDLDSRGNGPECGTGPGAPSPERGGRFGRKSLKCLVAGGDVVGTTCWGPGGWHHSASRAFRAACCCRRASTRACIHFFQKQVSTVLVTSFTVAMVKHKDKALRTRSRSTIRYSHVHDGSSTHAVRNVEIRRNQRTKRLKSSAPLYGFVYPLFRDSGKN